MTTLRVQMLGAFRIWRDGALLPDGGWPTYKSKALVKILLTERGRFVPAERLTDWLWPEVPPKKAQNNLWVAASQARRVLQPDLPPRVPSGFLHTGREGYSFAPAQDCRAEIDAEAFTERLRAARTAADSADHIALLDAARALYGGPYLEEDPYEDWAIPTRERLAEEFLALLADLADACAREGRYGRAVALCQESLRHDRLREATYRSLMLYHYCAGEQPLALMVYKQCRRVLQQEMGSRPEPQTTRLYRQIQRRELQTSGGEPAYPEPRPLLPESYSLGRTPLVGRDREYALLARLIGETGEGSGQVVLVEGEPGIGKSRLVQEAAGYARTRGARVLLTNCYQIEQAMPYQPVIDLVSQIIENTPPETINSLGESAQAEIAALVPGIVEASGRLPASPADLPETRQSRLFRALLQLLDAFTAEGRLLIAVDDIHWADDASLRFLHHLARQATRRRVVLICTCRPEEMAADERLTAFVHSVKREPGARSLPLGRLRFADAHALLAGLADPLLHTRQLGEWLHRETDGNPFFFLSILQSLLEQGLVTATGAAAWQVDPGALDAVPASLTLPEALRESVRARILRLPAPVRPILDAAAVLGRRFDFALLRGLTGEADAALLDALDLLVRRHLLVEGPGGDGYDFSHDKVREVVYHDLGAARRILLHRAAAEAMERESGGDERAGPIAEHFERGQVWEKAVTCLARAADRSLDLFALREALQYFDRAVALAQARLGQAHPEAADRRVLLDLYERRGGARAQAGQIEGAVADLGVVIEAARQIGDRDRERDLLIRLGMAYRRADSYSQAQRCLRAALDAARASGDARQAADTLYHLGTVAWSDGDNARAMDFHEEAVAICGRLGLSDRVAVQAFHGRGESYFADALPEVAIDCFEESLRLARAIGDRSYECENLMMIGYACTGSMGLADYPRARERLEAAQVLVEASQLEWHAGPVGIGLAHVRAGMGEYQEAWDGLHEMIRRLESLGLVRYRIMACSYLGCLLQDLNLPERAAAFHEEGLRLAEQKKVAFFVPRLRADLALDQLRSGRIPDAAGLREALETAQTRRENYLAMRCLEVLAEISLARGEAERAIAYADALGMLAERGGLREMAAVAHFARGRALAVTGEPAAAETELRQAAALATEIGRVRLCWEVHGALSLLCRRQGRGDEADRQGEAARDASARITGNLRDPVLRSALAKT